MSGSVFALVGCDGTIPVCGTSRPLTKTIIVTMARVALALAQHHKSLHGKELGLKPLHTMLSFDQPFVVAVGEHRLNL